MKELREWLLERLEDDSFPPGEEIALQGKVPPGWTEKKPEKERDPAVLSFRGHDRG